MIKAHRKNGKLEGLEIRLLPEGRKVIRFYKEDKAYGFEIMVDKSNKITSVSNCEIDNTRQKEADCEQIYIPGYEAQMKAYGQNEGDHEDYHGNGQLAVLRKYKAGKVQEEKTYFDDGKMKPHILYDGRFPIKETVYYQNGKIKLEETYTKEDKWISLATYKEYYGNG